MSIDSMRVGGGRCPFLIVGGLLIVCVMLLCNWWTLAAENTELLRQIDELSEQLKFSVDERDKCVTRLGETQQDYKRLKDEIATLHVHLEQQSEVNKRNEELEESIAVCKDKLESLTKLHTTQAVFNLESLKQEKDGIYMELKVKQEENKKLQEELNKVVEEYNKLKLTLNSPLQNKIPKMINTAAMTVNKPQLDPVAESSVKVSTAGQRGLRFHGIPILPQDSPGAKRQTPRFSVTMLKGPDESEIEE